MSTLPVSPAAGTVDRAARRAARRRDRRWKVSPLLIVTALVAVVGVTVIAYLPAAKWISRLNQAAVVDRYRRDVDHADPSAAAQLRSAKRYNDALSAGALVAANTNVPTGAGTTSDDHLDYWKQLRTKSGVMARIQIPSIDVDLPIYHGTSQATLLKGAGHLQGTSLPIGGSGTHSVITAHRGLAQATMFTDLDRLSTGDRFTITTFGRVLSYEVVDRKVVQPEDTATLEEQPGKDLVTLVTCTPLGINSHRMLVTGRRVSPVTAKDLAAARSGPAPAPFPWFAPAYLAALAAIAGYARWAGMNLAVVGGPGSPPDPWATADAVSSGTGARTALLDRPGLVEALAESASGIERNGVAVLFVRPDRLDRLDPGGVREPMAGDEVLEAFAGRLVAATGPAGRAARISSSTFVAVRDEVEGAVGWAEAVVSELAGSKPTAGDAVVPAGAAVLVTTDGFHHDPDTLVADVEVAAQRGFATAAGGLEHLRVGLAASPGGAEPEAGSVGGTDLASDLDRGARGGTEGRTGPSVGAEHVEPGPRRPPASTGALPRREPGASRRSGARGGVPSSGVAASPPAGTFDPSSWLDIDEAAFLSRLRATRAADPTAVEAEPS